MNTLGGSDPDAFKEPVGFHCVWTTYGTSGVPPGSFWKAEAPFGYVALGDVALACAYPKDKKLRPLDIPRYVCIKKDYILDIKPTQKNHPVTTRPAGMSVTTAKGLSLNLICFVLFCFV